MTVKFEDYSIKVKAKLEEAALAYLHEASGELVSQTQRNTPVDTGQLKNSWTYKVEKSGLESTIGSPSENAIWSEFGTGEYALEGNGRKGGWHYKDQKGEWHYTLGRHPVRAFNNAYTKLKPKLKKRAEDIFKGKLK